jgi:heptosyltransferase I
LGDVCNAIPSVVALQRHFPEARITWVCGRIESELVSLVPGIEVIVFDKRQGLKGFLKLRNVFKLRRFDILLHMQVALRANLLSLLISADRKLGFSADRSRDLHRLFIDEGVPSPPSEHVLDGFMAFAAYLGASIELPSWPFEMEAFDTQWAQSIFSQTSRRLILVPGASKAYKNWTMEGYLALIEHAQSQGWEIVLAGSPSKSERELAERLMHSSQGLINLVGATSLAQLLSLIKAADLVIAPDTGPVHLANALHTPVMGLYAHHNPARVGPYHYLDYAVSVYDQALALEHSSLSDSNPAWRTRVKDPDSMRLLKVARVTAVFDKIVEDFNL